MRFRLLSLLVMSALALTGCTTGESQPAASQPPAIENFEGDAEAQERVAGYAEAINASYAKLYETGMAESVTSAGDEYILSYTPGEEFYAGLYNVEIDDVIVVEDELFFTVATAYRAIQDPTTVITETETGVSITHPEFGDFTIVIENGLVVSGFDNGGSWTGEFVYEPNPRVSELIAEVLAEEQAG